MKELLLNNKIIAYSYEYIPIYSNVEILNKIKSIIKEQHWVKSDAYVFSKTPIEFEDIYNFCSDKCNKLNQNNKKFNLHKWISILRSNPVQPMELDIEYKEPTYHNHVDKAKMLNKMIPLYSFVYYFQMPNNLNGIDGNILFKDDDNNVLKYLPIENEVLIFKSDISHAPIHAKNSTKNRIVLAGDFIILDELKPKTLI